MEDADEPSRPSGQSGNWGASEVRALRKRLRMSQAQLAEELGVRQQTVSEWETGAYRPRGASAKLLRLVAERAELRYDPSPADERRVVPEGESPQ